MAELSLKQDGNPAAKLRKELPALNLITDRDELAGRAIDIVESSTASDEQIAKFRRTVDQIPDLVGVQSYVFNFVLAADGQRVWTKRQGEHDDTRRRYGRR